MDLADLKRKAEAAREYTVQAAGCTFTCRLPTPSEAELELARAYRTEQAELAIMLRVQRALLERAVVSWSGVTQAMLAPGATDDPAEVSPDAVALLLDADPDVSEALQQAFVARSRERQQRKAAAEKN